MTVTQMTGKKGKTAETTLFAYRLRFIPTAMGMRVVGMAILTALTGTTVPMRNLEMSGVMKIAPIVVAVVIITERVTFPMVIYVQRLDA